MESTLDDQKSDRIEEDQILPQIETVVYLMFENRSLDNLLGWLYENDKPKNMVPPTPQGPQFDGLRENTYSLPLKPHFWSKVEYYPIQKGLGKDGFTVPSLDPNEGYPNVLNQLFGDAENTVNTPPCQHILAPMQGFLQDFDANDDTWDETLQITETYTPDDLPVINGLARQYAVSDRWYCSMPTQTNPNRAFSLCGTSLGRLVNKHFTAIEQFKTPTIFNVLAKKGTSMGIYYHDVWHEGKCFTQYTFPAMDSVPPALLSIENINDPANGFFALAKAGKLPEFTYIEPKWGYGIGPGTLHQGNDYHPPTDVRYGEKLLYDVYTALKSNPDAWKKTLLVVTFDEHGGTYDHHSPAWGALNPGDKASLASSFKFNLYGVRVPALLISPYVVPGTVFRQPADSTCPYDHTSILASVLKWKGIDPAESGLLSRVATAPSFETVISDNIVNPGIDLPDPGAQYQLSMHNEGPFADIPASVVRYIYASATTEQDLLKLLEDYKSSLQD